MTTTRDSNEAYNEAKDEIFSKNKEFHAQSFEKIMMIF